MNLQDELEALTIAHADVLDGFPWASEQSRWAELVFCVVHAAGADAERARQVVDVLHALDLLAPPSLATAIATDREATTVLRFTLERHGLDGETASDTASVLAHLAASTVDRYGGKIQRLLREHGRAILDTLSTLVPPDAADDAALRRGFTLWLQNVADLPVSVLAPPVAAFIAARGITLGDVEDAADELDLNLALVDDVLAAAAQTSTTSDDATPSPEAALA